MSPLEFQHAMKARGFTLGPSGYWHGPFGIIVAGTYNTINTTSLADRARWDSIRQLDATLASKRKFYDAK
jgi:hypothetical protein